MIKPFLFIFAALVFFSAVSFWLGARWERSKRSVAKAEPEAEDGEAMPSKSWLAMVAHGNRQREKARQRRHAVGDFTPVPETCNNGDSVETKPVNSKRRT